MPARQASMQQQLLRSRSSTASTRLCSVNATYQGTPGQLQVTADGSVRFTPLDANRSMPNACCCVENSMDVRGVLCSKCCWSTSMLRCCQHVVHLSTRMPMCLIQMSICVLHIQECAAQDVLGATHDGNKVVIWNTRHKAQGHKAFRYVRLCVCVL